jgi:hypothetical protein
MTLRLDVQAAFNAMLHASGLVYLADFPVPIMHSEPRFIYPILGDLKTLLGHTKSGAKRMDKGTASGGTNIQSSDTASQGRLSGYQIRMVSYIPW